MYIRSKRLVALVVIGLLLMTLAASGFPQSWIGGYRISIDGFAEHAPFSGEEYFGLHIFTAPFQREHFDPVLAIGLEHAFSCDEKTTILDVEFDMRLALVRNHPLSMLFRRESAWVPAIGVSHMMDLSDNACGGVWCVEAKPFAFFFGEKTVSVLGLRLAIDTGKHEMGWGVRLLELSHFFF